MLLVSNKVTKDDRTDVLSVTFANDRALDQSEDEYIVSPKSKRHSLLGFRRAAASCEAQPVSKDRYAIGNFQSTSACATLH